LLHPLCNPTENNPDDLPSSLPEAGVEQSLDTTQEALVIVCWNNGGLF
jgi:hypothetical protein